MQGASTLLFTLSDLIASSSSKHVMMAKAAVAGADSGTTSLYDSIHDDDNAPSATAIVAATPDDLKQADLVQQLHDVMMLTSFISVAAARYLYQTTYKDSKPDITTGDGAAKFVKEMANAKNYVLTNALGGYLSSESLLARSFNQTVTTADLHLEFLSTLFDGFNFPPATIKELDSVLSSVTDTLKNLRLSWSDQNSTLDHMVFLYYFEAIQGLDNVKVPKVRIYFLHIDQGTWTATVGKSSVNHVSFHMNFSDGVYSMDTEQIAQDRPKIKALLTKLSGMSMDELDKLLSPKVVNPSPSPSA